MLNDAIPDMPPTWEEKHQADFAAIHEALRAVMSLDLSGTGGPVEWLASVRSIRQKVAQFSLLVPNAKHWISILDTAEKVLVAVMAVSNIAKDA